MAKPILISEIFGPTIQGEGNLIGKPTVFVRTGSCDFRCAWCDTLYAVLPEHKGEWTPMQAEEIVAKVLRLTGGAAILVTISGGNPALHDLSSLLEIGHQNGLTFALETQGSVAREWFHDLDYLVLSPKGPSSGMTFDETKLRACLENAGSETQIVLKIVVFDEEDYAFARKVSTLFPEMSLVLQAGSSAPVSAEKISKGVDWLLQRAAQDGWFDVTILPQLHVLLWGSKRGV